MSPREPAAIATMKAKGLEEKAAAFFEKLWHRFGYELIWNQGAQPSKNPIPFFDNGVPQWAIFCLAETQIYIYVRTQIRPPNVGYLEPHKCHLVFL